MDLRESSVSLGIRKFPTLKGGDPARTAADQLLFGLSRRKKSKRHLDYTSLQGIKFRQRKIWRNTGNNWR